MKRSETDRKNAYIVRDYGKLIGQKLPGCGFHVVQGNGSLQNALLFACKTLMLVAAKKACPISLYLRRAYPDF